MNPLNEINIYSWLKDNDIKTEVGLPLDFRDHRFMFDIYNDLTPVQAIMKAAQITASTCFSLKVPWVVKNIGLDAIYTLPTETDRNSFVGGKINRTIAQNPILQEWTKDKDSIEQKQIGKHIIHYRGTWTSKAAIMVPSDLNVYDEIDASKQSVIEQYATRLQHSKFRWEWYLSHPSAEGFGIHKIYEKSDQKHWFVECSHCGEWQYLNWPESICLERQIFQCKHCQEEIYDRDRRNGLWVKRFKDREISGYWVPLLICPWISAKEIIGYFNDKSEEYFYNKVLGLPYTGRGNKLTKNHLLKNLTLDIITPIYQERMVIGVDTGLKIDYVMGGVKGLFYHGESEDYAELDKHMKEWPKAIAIVDGGGDLIGSRKFKARWPSRVFLCFLTGDKKGTDEPEWKDDNMVIVDRNKFIQIVVDEFIDGDIKLQGTEDDWYEYWLDWNNLTRIKITDSVTGEFKGNKWVRSGRDHRALATVFWKVGMTKFGQGNAKIFTGEPSMFPTSAPVFADKMTIIGRHKLLLPEKEESNDWRE